MRLVPLSALALVVVVSACNTLLGIDGDFGPLGEGGIGGSGGTNTGTNTGTGLGPGPGAGPPAQLGEPCGTDAGCAEGVCGVDFVCCDERCEADCFSCLEDETGQPDGTCAPVFDGTDECNGPQSCIAGVCGLKPAGLDCNAGNECIGTCSADGVCCDKFCSGPCESCLQAETGMAQGTCAPIPMAMTPMDECDPGEVCDGAGACKKNQGVPCTAGPASQCLSGNCVDGVCCDTACDQTCEACTVALTGSPDGICSPIPAGMDPEMECGAMTCDGSGMCQ
ncbi:MAG TPA: hypothetical protein ENK57_04390 [Polyangiaceae bacterium]|nr:hypothetical protein [Polyangiaceae bacterium]